MTAWMTATEAADRLGVKRETVYAYASRGFLRSTRSADGRSSLFDVSEVERLAVRGRRSGTASPLAVESGLTAIEGGRLFYRGRDAVELSRRWPFEKVADLLWDVDGGDDPWAPDDRAAATAAKAQRALPHDTLPFDRLRVSVAALAASDHLRFDMTPEPVVATGRSLIATLVDSLPALQPDLGPSMAERVWTRLSARRPKPGLLEVLGAAMVLTADHELSPSTLAVRIAASVRAEPYAVVATGMGVMAGTLHGAASLAAEELLAEVDKTHDAAAAIGRRLRRGERIPGFGQPLYPEGDPRGIEMLRRLQRVVGVRPLAPARQVISTMRSRRLPLPNVDFGLAALATYAGMVRGAGEAIMTVSRTVGWIAHALEEYAQPTGFRPRAIYTGPPPASQVTTKKVMP